DSTRLSSVPVPGLQRAIQRAQRLCPQSRLAAERPYRLRGVRRLRYSLTLRDLSEIMLLRGLAVSHELYPAVGEEAAAGDGRGVAQVASRPRTQLWPELVCRRNLPQGPGSLVLFVSGDRSRREPDRHDAER